MTYLQTTRNRSGRRSRAVFAATALIAAVAIGIHLLFPHFFPALFTSVARPFWRTEFSIEAGSLESPSAILSENEALKRELAAAAVQLQSTQEIISENAELKSILGRASSTPYILAAVLERPPFASYDSLIIDAGTDHGFAIGDRVYAPGNVLIGRISDVLSQTSKVTLFSFPGEKYEVLIGAGHSPAQAVGQGGGQYKAELPSDAKISEGDAVTAPSLDGMPFGIVLTVLSDAAEPFETVLFAPSVNIYQLRWVLIDTR